jgi:hypothetical protein
MPNENESIDVDALYDSVMGAQEPTWGEPGELSQQEPGQNANVEQESSEPETKVDDGQYNEFLEQMKAAKIPIKWGGEEKIFDGEKVIQYAQQGYDYNVKNRELKQQRQTFDEERENWEAEKSEWSGKYEEYQKWDQFLKDNPHVFQEVQQRVQQVQSGHDPNAMFTMPGQMSPQVQQLQEQVKSLQERLAKEDQERAQKIESQKEAKLDETITSYKDKYSSFDWEKQDEFGHNLEEQILNHALNTGIKDFKAAANDYLFDEHLKIAQLNAQEKAGKKIQSQHKKGLGEIRSEPMRKMTEKSSGKKGSYDDIMREVAEEYGINI